MNVQIYPKLCLATSLKFPANVKLEHRETITMQEQFTGPVPLRGERSAADVLAERLAESGADGTPTLFIP